MDSSLAQLRKQFCPMAVRPFRKGYPRQVLTAVESPGIVGAGSESLDITGQCDLLKIGLAGEVHRKFGRGEGSFTQIDDRTVLRGCLQSR